MNPSTLMKADGVARGQLRLRTWPLQDSSTTDEPRQTSNRHQALTTNTHTVWDNSGCLAPQTSTEVSGFRLVDWLDKDM